MKIFLNYRRTDNPHATDRLVDRLVVEFGRENVFYDIDSIPIGVNWRAFVTENVSRCDAFIAVVGDHWLDELRQREGTKDMVRTEIETALRRGVPIVPVQVGQAAFPIREALPGDIADFADWNGLELRAGRDFHADVQRLIDRLKELSGALRSMEQPGDQSPSTSQDRATIDVPEVQITTRRVTPFLDVSRVDDVALVTIRGKSLIDELECNALQECLTSLASEPQPRIVIDFEQVLNLSSVGMQKLFGAYRRARLAGGDIRVCRLHPSIQEVFRITRINKIIGIDETPEESIRILKEDKIQTGEGA